MRFYAKPKFWSQLYRPALYVIFIGGLLVALWPAEQAVSGWQSQRALRAAWDQAEAQQRAKHKTAAKATPPSHATPQQAKAVPPAPTVPATHSKTVPAKHTLPAHHRPHHAAPPQTYTTYTGLPPLRLVIPSIDLDAMVVEGVDPAALSQGPGHDPTSALPGSPGNCIIAAHRNMYGWWFYRLGKLGHNAVIQLRMPGQTFTYKVAKSTVVRDTDTAITRRSG